MIANPLINHLLSAKKIGKLKISEARFLAAPKVDKAHSNASII